ncbi:MAG: T9SS type A sorting domain-containing protein [Crocinitomicaceae bacterium]|nr:T9SS type A sorting domain-containing protein [Flavobacteriales bacterium]NQZ35881.1 T9SS type A sorting domain-containing protein [Crocinitomicaceae bacterium]
MKTIIVVTLAILITPYFTNAQNVTIPDANFKTYLTGNLNINTNGDTEIQTLEASAFTGAIDVTNLGITDFTGIEAFVLITSINCSNNQLLSLDLSANSMLEALTCTSNQIGTLDFANNPNLQYLYCPFNNITSLDISQCTDLSSLNCNSNTITSLDVTNNSSLNIVDCSDNQITALDFSNSPNLHTLKCFSNNLNVLNIANGNNGPVMNFQANSNPNLSCIQVDDIVLYNTNFLSSIDPIAYFSLNCAIVSLNEQSTDQLNIYPNPVQNILYIDYADILLQGVEIIDFSGATVLKMPESVTSIDVSQLPQGLYFIRFYKDENPVHQRFVKQ